MPIGLPGAALVEPGSWSKSLVAASDNARPMSSGSIGDLGAFSFQSSKLITSGEGGIVITNNLEYFERVQSYINTAVANPALPLRTPDAPQVYAILDTQLRRAANGQATGPEAAAAAVAAWVAHDRTQDAEQLKMWRRKAAGLD